MTRDREGLQELGLYWTSTVAVAGGLLVHFKVLQVFALLRRSTLSSSDHLFCSFALFLSLLELQLFHFLLCCSILDMQLLLQMAQVRVLNLYVAHLLNLFCCFLNNTWRQIDFKLIWNRYTFCLAIDQGLRQLLSICFVTTIMLTFDM